jgi:hypothetical protein
MELSSMLAGEPFTDCPQCVCPVIAEFLRTYNDEVDERRRSDLYRYASEAVGTNAGHDIECLRADMCLRWWASMDKPIRRRIRMLVWGLAPAAAARDSEIAYRAAKKAAASRALHGSALALLDDLVSVGRPRTPAVPSAEPADLPAQPADVPPSVPAQA